MPENKENLKSRYKMKTQKMELKGPQRRKVTICPLGESCRKLKQKQHSRTPWEGQGKMDVGAGSLFLYLSFNPTEVIGQSHGAALERLGPEDSLRAKGRDVWLELKT